MSTRSVRVCVLANIAYPAARCVPKSLGYRVLVGEDADTHRA